MISKSAGGIGLSLHDVRASGSYVRGINGTAKGLVPLLRLLNNVARHVEQGGGKRKGSLAVYLEPWHADIASFLEMKRNHGAEDERARDLFYALWVPDLFMRRVEEDAEWYTAGLLLALCRVHRWPSSRFVLCIGLPSTMALLCCCCFAATTDGVLSVSHCEQVVVLPQRGARSVGRMGRRV